MSPKCIKVVIKETCFERMFLQIDPGQRWPHLFADFQKAAQKSKQLHIQIGFLSTAGGISRCRQTIKCGIPEMQSVLDKQSTVMQTGLS